MYYLIDYENVHSAGLQGVETLLPEDTLEIYFSDARPYLHGYDYGKIVNSECQCSYYYLGKASKNANDFRIVMRAIIILLYNPKAKIRIVTSDTNFEDIKTFIDGELGFYSYISRSDYIWGNERSKALKEKNRKLANSRSLRVDMRNLGPVEYLYSPLMTADIGMKTYIPNNYVKNLWAEQREKVKNVLENMQVS